MRLNPYGSGEITNEEYDRIMQAQLDSEFERRVAEQPEHEREAFKRGWKIGYARGRNHWNSSP